MKHAHKIILALCVAACLYVTWSCAGARVAAPIVLGTAAGVATGGTAPFLVAIIAASGTWLGSAAVNYVDPPPCAMPPVAGVPWYLDGWAITKALLGWGVLVLILWLLAKRLPMLRHGVTVATLGVNKIAARVAKRVKSPFKNVKVTVGEHPG